MHDEAATHYVDMIDQTTLGHRFIKKEFDVVPRIGWQIDPFGHSAVQAYLLGAEVGFDSLFFGRIDYQDKAKRKNEKNLEIIWQGSKSLGSSAQIFTGLFPENYEPPPGGFYFEVNDASPIVQDDINLFDYNVQDRVNDFVAAAVSQAARQLEFFKGRSNSGPNTESLADALAIAQHHDAVTGTEKQHVANDYAKRLSIGYTEAEELVASSLACLTQSALDTGCGNPTVKFQQCPLLNISYCPASEVDLSEGKKLIVVVYNSLGWKRDDVIQIPVINEEVAVHDREGGEIESQLLPLTAAYVGLRNYHAKAYVGRSPAQTPKYLLAFKVSVPPLGFSMYSISNAKRPGASSARSSVHTFQSSEKSTVEVGDGNVEEPVEQSFSYYSGYNGTADESQNSGAYIFRPNGTFPIQPEGQVVLTVFRGPLVEEVHQQITPWIYQVGPIPVDDGVGKEVATQITTSMNTNKTFYTDSNGRDFIKRIRDHRTDWNLEVNQPVAGNYYPINLGIFMQDNRTEFSILVDRSLGGSSIVDGQIELMLHRRLLLDDSRGVAEALNETVCVLNKCTGLTIQGKFYFRFDPLGEGAKWRRTVGQEIYSPLLLAFAEQDGDNWMDSHVASFSGIDPSYSLPDNVALITLQISRVTETNLSANQDRKEMEKKRLVWKVEGSSREEQKFARGGPVDPAKLLVELAPMEIRTFVIEFSAATHHDIFDV
ncbi:Lysosomal alpha-mannosidase [Morella rubra]|uniref:Lysosomal alpha-mannosidase n=1 Tax=Morella rubra TaxID=262757 RepID=A0A6A1UGX3_9ROSI|nr:Lysosomal alpha-mannosidase [Morella rubra]